MTDYHFIGIGGVGMSGLAHLMVKKKFHVTGSDLAFNPLIEKLIQEGATVYKGQSAENIRHESTVVYSTDIKPDNPEYSTAIQKQCRMLHRSDLLAELCYQHRSLAVTGTHGKTSTSALLASVITKAGKDPSFSVGGMLIDYFGNAQLGQGDLFIFEADESDGSFLRYSPFGAIVTNIDRDHLNYYENNEQKLIEAFGTFMSKVLSPKHLVWCGDDANLVRLNPPGQSYGFNQNCDWKLSNFRQDGFKVWFNLEGKGKSFDQIEVALSGRHQALNAASVFVLCLELGLSEEAIRHGLKTFGGVMRRCEKKGEFNGILFLDDYAHHPTEIETTLVAIRKSIKNRRLIVVFQPHRYSRTEDCLGQFGKIFESADVLILTDIYGAGEKAIPGISHEKILAEVLSQSSIPCHYIPRPALGHFIAQFSMPHDIIVTMGAGDITKVGPETLAIMEKEPAKKLKLGLIFGGSKTEHEISIRSAAHFRESLINPLYQVEEFGITKEGTWIHGQDVKEKLTQLAQENKPAKTTRTISNEVIDKLTACDVLIPVLHGPLGEDGMIQGFFEVLGKAYVGCNHRAAAIAMDKLICKKLALFHGIATSPFVEISLEQWKNSSKDIVNTILQNLIFPVFVKPIHLGSAVGVKKVESQNDLRAAIDQAFRYDTTIVVENGIVGRELEFAVLGNDEAYAFPPGEILTKGQVYDYQGKYSTNGIPTTPQAELSQELIEEGRKLAQHTYQILGCSGLARVDFFLDSNGKYWLNEINPMPGFTAISLYPQICAVNGLKGDKLMENFIILALERHRNQQKIK